MQTPMLSIVVPVYNEAGNVRVLYDRLVSVLEPLALEWELIPVDDGSSDGTLDELQGLQAADPRVRPISFSRNFGHQVALTAGLDAARGAAVVCMDGDLQHPPEVLPELLAKYRHMSVEFPRVVTPAVVVAEMAATGVPAARINFLGIPHYLSFEECLSEEFGCIYLQSNSSILQSYEFIIYNS